MWCKTGGMSWDLEETKQDASKVSRSRWPLRWVLKNTLELPRIEDQEDGRSKCKEARESMACGWKHSIWVLAMPTPFLYSPKEISNNCVHWPLGPKLDCKRTRWLLSLRFLLLRSESALWPVYPQQCCSLSKGCLVIPAKTCSWQALTHFQVFARVYISFCISSFSLPGDSSPWLYMTLEWSHPKSDEQKDLWRKLCIVTALLKSSQQRENRKQIILWKKKTHLFLRFCCFSPVWFLFLKGPSW